jgi:glycosyltransferase involved in cell wall biosynthesis
MCADAARDSEPDAAARAAAVYWRGVAEERTAALHRVTHRPSVRAVLAIDRRVEPYAHALSALFGRARAKLATASLAAAGITSSPTRTSRDRALRARLASVESVSNARRVSIVVPADGHELIAGLALGARSAPGDVLCFLPAPVEPGTDAWMAHLANALGDGVVAATPTLLHPTRPRLHATEHDRLVRAEGFDFETDRSGAPVAVARHAGATPDVGAPVHDVAAAPLQCLVVERAAYDAVGGLDRTAAADPDVAGIGLCARLRQCGGRVVHVPAAAVFDGRPVRSRLALRQPVDASTADWRAVVETHGPYLTRTARVRWVLTTSAPSMKVAKRWGDWHLAVGLAEALRRAGQDVVVQSHDDAGSLRARSRDVHVVVRGLASVRRTPGQRHVLWVVSHPEALTADDCEDADLVLVASRRFAAHLRTLTSTPVEEFLQASDPRRFCPGPVDPAHHHPVTVVANTRGVMRRSVEDALAAGIRPAIYGGGWDGLVDPALVVADHVDNELLPAVYRSAGMVLNDHWDTMRTWGFVSNRVYDVLACGTPVVSDRVDEIDDLFDRAVPMYRGSAELGEVVRTLLAGPDQARAAAERGRAQVLAHHTFDHRAAQLLALLERHGMSPAGA